ncbi:hypothetical protein LNL84_06160 [Vibrio sp. ZSDZ34]|uniref:Uncharacterized protein n=1 Tax=Vibrio gelatinilyticus TaxID=2893468 RepID=A0A9X1WAC5_9VIBR|nr:hypothetical protein [Vibrio gelatinilyticus]MCJ2376416.1 hypothetical protein [Vibrio gelatinilyticus]
MYRYSINQFSSLLTVFGGIRVGTLHDFRKSEHKRGIADPQEGKKTVQHCIDKETITIGDRSSKTARAAKEFNIIGGSGTATFENVTFSKTFNSPDFFILCSSYEKSKSVMSQFEGADTCVQITDPLSFYKELTILLNSITPVVFLGVHRVTYKERIEEWNGTSWGADPTLLKEPEFSKQKEVRAIWAPKYRQPITPQILGSVDLAKTCRKIAI